MEKKRRQNVQFISQRSLNDFSGQDRVGEETEGNYQRISVIPEVSLTLH